MPTAALVWLISLAGIIVSLGIGPFVKNKKATLVFQGVGVAAVLVFLVCTGIGLWQAWVPWELTRK